MTVLEDRLTVALDARAEQLQQADLSPAELPEAGHHRNRFALGLAAAACVALVIGVPVAVAQLDGSPAPRSPASTPSSTEPPPSPGVGEGADWPITRVGRIDLDGDGTDETMRLRLDPTVGLNPNGDRAARVEVALPSGTVYTVLSDGPEYDLEGAVDLPGSAGQELLVRLRSSLRVLDLVDGQLQELKASEDPPLIRRTDNQGRTVTWVADEHGLSTIRSDAPVLPTALKYGVGVWHWKVADGALVSGDPDAACIDAAEPDVVLASCFPVTPSRLEPVGLTQVLGSTSVELGFPVDGHVATARVEYRPGFAGDFISEGDAHLVVTSAGRTWRVGIPAGGIPRLVKQPVNVDPAGRRGVLVIQLGVETEDWDVFTWSRDELVLLDPTGETYFGTALGTHPDGSWDDAKTWLQDGWIYSAYGDRTRYNLYRWWANGTHLQSDGLAGTYCFSADRTGHPC